MAAVRGAIFTEDSSVQRWLLVTVVKGAMRTAEVAVLRSAVQRWLLVAVKRVRVEDRWRAQLAA